MGIGIPYALILAYLSVIALGVGLLAPLSKPARKWIAATRMAAAIYSLVGVFVVSNGFKSQMSQAMKGVPLLAIKELFVMVGYSSFYGGRVRCSQFFWPQKLGLVVF